MRSRLMSGIAAIALTACTVVATAAPASAAPWGWHHGWHGGWGGAVAAGVIGGAVAAATSPLWAPGYYDHYPGYAYEPYGYTVAPGPMAGGNDTAYCEQRFRSYNPSTGTYLGFDGQYHPCP